MRKLMTTVCIMVIATGMIFAGGTGESKSSTTETVTLRWLMQVASAEEARQWRELAAGVTERYPDILVELSTTDWNGYWTKLPSELAGGNPPDILYMQSMRAKDYLEAGFLPLSQYVADDPDINIADFYSGILEGLSIGEELYCLPYDFGPYVMFYNQDLFDLYGLPYPDTIETAEDFEELCSQFAGHDTYGTVVPTVMDKLYTYFLGSGASLFAADGTVKVNDSRIIETIEYLQGLIDQGYAPRISDTGNNNWDREQFYAGNVATYLDGPWNLTNIKEKSSFAVGVTMVPPGNLYRRSQVAGSGFGISKDTDYPGEAYLAIKELTSKNSLSKLAGWGRALPARSSVRDVYYELHADVNGLHDAVEKSITTDIGVPFITPMKWQQVTNTISQNLEAIFIGNVSARKGLDNAQEIIDGILGQ
ncbi:MAG TPA: hypothetical protein DEZ27_01445 [Sphaerochaeta sp.]|nr:hypothetical protein [Sphaerochaeta sp.]